MEVSATLIRSFQSRRHRVRRESHVDWLSDTRERLIWIMEGRDVVVHVSASASVKDKKGQYTDHNSKYRPWADQ